MDSKQSRSEPIIPCPLHLRLGSAYDPERAITDDAGADHYANLDLDRRRRLSGIIQPVELVSSDSEQFALEGLAEPRLEFVMSPTPLHDETLVCVFGRKRPQDVS